MDRPTVTLIMVMTADGFIAKNAHHLVNWSSKEDKKHFVSKTRELEYYISGSNSFETIGKPLPGRKNIVLTSRPEEMASKYPEGDELKFLKVEKAIDAVNYVVEQGGKTIGLGGGATINQLFAKEGLIDYVYLTIEPLFFGKGINIFAGDIEFNLELISSEKLNDNGTLLCYYKVLKN